MHVCFQVFTNWSCLELSKQLEWWSAYLLGEKTLSSNINQTTLMPIPLFASACAETLLELVRLSLQASNNTCTRNVRKHISGRLTLSHRCCVTLKHMHTESASKLSLFWRFLPAWLPDFVELLMVNGFRPVFTFTLFQFSRTSPILHQCALNH